MFFKRYGNLVLGVVFLVASVVYYFVADALPPSKVMKIGPDFVPKIIAGLTFIFSSVLIVASIGKLRAAPPQAEAKSEIEYVRVLLTIGVFGCYVYLFEPLGFPLATFLYLFAQMLVMAPREKIRIPLFLGIAVAGSIAIYYIFKFRLDVMLPAGLLG